MILQFYARKYFEEKRRKRTRGNLYNYIHSKEIEEKEKRKNRLNTIIMSNDLLNIKSKIDMEIDDTIMVEEFVKIANRYCFCPKTATYVLKYIIDASYPNNYLNTREYQEIFMELYKNKGCSEYLGHFLYYTEFPNKLESFKKRLENNHKPKVEDNNLLVKALTRSYNYERSMERKNNFVSNKYTPEVKQYDYTEINEAEFFKKIKKELKGDTKSKTKSENTKEIILC